MRGDPDQHEDLEELGRRYEGRQSESFLFRKSPLTIRTHTPPGRSSSPTVFPSSSPPLPTSNSTPLLTATLNAPVAYYNNIRTKSDVPSLSGQVATKSKLDESNSLSSSQSTSFYSTLLHQLRQKTGDSGPKPAIQLQSIKIKKEKSKPLQFVCPACKKRFQRHIAMNAHFQNEHISLPSPNRERVCKLCSSVSASLTAVRQHLRTVHNIDLDNPNKCADEVKMQKYSVLEASLRSGGYPDESEPSCSNIEMYDSGQSSPQSVSPSPAHTPTSTESPECSLFPIKQEGGSSVGQLDTEDPQVEDLSIRKPSSPSPHMGRRFSPAPPRSPRPDSPCAKQSKRVKLSDNSPVSPTAGPTGNGLSSTANNGYCCTHCNIVYPNQTLYFLHRGFHSESNPWRCNACGHISSDLYDFNTHLFSVAHQ